MSNKKSSELMHELATKTIVIHATTRKLKQTDDKSLFSLIEDTLEDIIQLQRRLQLEINQ